MGNFSLPKTYFPFKNYDKKLVFLQRIGSFFSCHAQGKKLFFPIRAVSFCETFCTCSPSSLGQDLKFNKNAILFIYLFSFGLLELEMVVLNVF
jgi:hypothetical protein